MRTARDAVGSRGEDWFIALYERCYDDVLRYARRRVDEESARDAAAQTFTVAWRRLDAIPEVPLPWLYGVARKVLANESRRARRQDRIATEIANAPLASVDLAHRIGETQIIAAALAELSAPDLEVIRLIAWDGLDLREAAIAAGCSKGAFAVRLHRARRRLEKAISRQQDAPSTSSGTTAIRGQPGHRQEAGS